MLSLIPSIDPNTDVFPVLGVWADSIFQQLLPIIYILIGLSVGALIIAGIIYFVGGVPEFIRSIFHRRPYDGDFTTPSMKHRDSRYE